MELFGSWDLFGGKRLPAKSYSPAVAFRPALEGLEQRCVPASIVWQGQVGVAGAKDWNNGQNWVGGVAPTQNDDAVIGGGVECQVGNQGANAKSVTVLAGARLSVLGGALNINGGDLTNSGTLTVVNVGSISLAQLVGSVINNGKLVFGVDNPNPPQGVAVTGGTIQAMTVTNNQELDVYYFGGIQGDLVNNSQIAILDPRGEQGSPNNPSGALFQVTGDFNHVSNATLSANIYSRTDGKTPSDTMEVTGAAKLDGNLAVSGPANGNRLPSNTPWTLMKYGKQTTGFNSKTTTINGQKLEYTVGNTQLDVRIPGKVGQANPITPMEATPFNGKLASFTDPGSANPTPGNYVATVDWGDGTIDQQSIVTNAQGGFDVIGTHTYARYGGYSVTVTITNAAAPYEPLTLSTTANVYDVAPQVTAGPDATIPRGGTYTGSGSFTDPGANTWTATVDYGDGSGLQPLTLNPDKTFNLSHTYQYPSRYQVQVKVYDGAAYGMASFYVNVTM